jgi:hypothetical protein
MIKPPMKENIDDRYKKAWKRSEKQEEQVNEEHVQGIVLTGFAAAQDHDEFTGKEESVRIQEEDEEEDVKTQDDDRIQKEDEEEDVSTDEEEYYSASEKVLF